jgi:NADPH:quinone reductase-like Zn-dependent oxidoreductase
MVDNSSELMRGVVFEEFGEPADVLETRDLREPSPGPGEVRVRMLASPVNPSDLLMVRGSYGVRPALPATPGFEGVGIVEEAGSGFLGKLLVGKRVAALNRGGGNWSEQVVIRAKEAIPLARDLPLEQAAMFFVNPAAAFVMTRLVLKVPPGGWLLQTAAGSALGRMVIRLGKRFGFRTLNVVRRDEQCDELKQLGGDTVLVFDPERHDDAKFREQVAVITEKQGVPFAIDAVGGRTGSAVVACLGAGGRMLVYGTLTDDNLSFSPRHLMGPTACIEGFWLARWMENQGLWRKLRLVKRITGLMREGVLITDVGRCFALEQIADAVREAETSGRGGKVLLRIADGD